MTSTHNGGPPDSGRPAAHDGGPSQRPTRSAGVTIHRTNRPPFYPVPAGLSASVLVDRPRIHHSGAAES
jgi:hypothetical protein